MHNDIECACCGRSNVLLQKCSGCRLIAYCGKDCQSYHWRIKHKSECGQVVTDNSSQGSTDEVGKAPKCMLDEFITLEDNERTDSWVVSRVIDYHAWCVDEKNNIYDYPVNQILSEFWTDKVVRRPFDVEHVIKAYPFLRDFRKTLAPYQASIESLTHEEKMIMIANDTFPKNQSLECALTLYESNPRKFAMVIGSLGFIQSDGSIYWELG